MSIIASDIIKRGSSFIYNDETRPCHKMEQPEDIDFRLAHEMIVDIYETCDQGIKHNTIAKLTCMCVNLKVQGDVVACKDSNFGDVIEKVEHLGYPVSSLIIVHNIWINQNCSMSLVKEAFHRIQCILCRSANIEFNHCKDPGIYFDFSCMAEDAVKATKYALHEYNDGDMRMDKDDNSWYLHMIEWKPNNADNNAEVTEK